MAKLARIGVITTLVAAIAACDRAPARDVPARAPAPALAAAPTGPSRSRAVAGVAVILGGGWFVWTAP